MARRSRRGFKLRRKAARVFRWGCAKAGAVSRLFRWLKDGTKRLCGFKRGSGDYIRVGPEVASEAAAGDVPKGHLAVYIGGEDEGTCRVIVPVLYFNHPLFADLLRAAENVYGFDHPGAIQIPCPKSEFEHVKMRIAAAGGGCNRRGWQGWRV